MKSFFKYVLATITGIFILGFLFIGIMIATIANLSKTEKVKVGENTILKVELNYPISDGPINETTAIFSSLNPDGSKAMALLDILDQIDRASEDPNIKGIYLDMTFVGAGFARTSEIRTALEHFKESGKFIYAYGQAFYPQSYYLASVADSVFLHPEGSFLYNGLLADVVFLKEMFAKLGIEMQVIKHGKFKGATEIFERSSLSDENRFQIQQYINSINETITSQIADSRALNADSLMRIADDMLARTPETAMELGMIDQLMYRDQVNDLLRKASGIDESDKLKFMSLSRYKSTDDRNKGGSKDRIAVLYAEGDIVDGKGDAENVGGETFAQALEKIRKDEKIKAVVLRINSPGGSALASDVIYREVYLTRQVKPVIVSMGDVAASGGYYIAALADTIVALPSTITGSIGVFGVIPNTQKLLNEKLGIHAEYVGTGSHSDFGRLDRPLNEFEKTYFVEMIDSIYAQFVGIVGEGRNMHRSRVDSLAQGRVYTGLMAKDLGLTDVNGDLLDAIDIAAWKAGIEDYRLSSYPKRKSPIEEIINQLGQTSSKNQLKKALGVYYPLVQQIEVTKNIQGAQMRMPYLLHFNHQ